MDDWKKDMKGTEPGKMNAMRPVRIGREFNKLNKGKGHKVWGGVVQHERRIRITTSMQPALINALEEYSRREDICFNDALERAGSALGLSVGIEWRGRA